MKNFTEDEENVLFERFLYSTGDFNDFVDDLLSRSESAYELETDRLALIGIINKIVPSPKAQERYKEIVENYVKRIALGRKYINEDD